MKKVLLPLGIAAFVCSSSQASANETLLVNFWNHGNNPANANTATASDFAAADPLVDLGAAVNKVSFDNSIDGGGPLSAVGMTGLTIDALTANWAWNTTAGLYPDTPIVDSYLYDQNGGLGRVMTLSGFDEIATGDNISLTVWGVGDGTLANTDFQVDYNGALSPTLTTDYDNGILYQQFTFAKAAGQDSLTVNWGKAGEVTSGFGGFSLATTVPEPTSATLFGLGVLALLARRFR